MNIENQTQYILLGAVLTFSEYADVLQDLKIDDFCPELRDTFAAIRGYWEHNDKWNPVEVMGRYDNCKKAMGECLDAFGAEFIRNVTHDMMLDTPIRKIMIPVISALSFNNFGISDNLIDP